MKKIILVVLLLVFIAYGAFINTFYRPYNNDMFSDIGNNIVFIPTVYIMTLLFYGKYILGWYKDIFVYLIFYQL